MKGSSLKWGFSEMIQNRLRWMPGDISEKEDLKQGFIKMPSGLTGSWRHFAILGSTVHNYEIVGAV